MRYPVATALGAVLLGGSFLFAQSAYKRDLPDALAKRAKITEATAGAIAQKRLPTATIQAVELEQENGKLIYSYEMKVAGKSGVEEVNVDAMSGKVLAVQHESPATERKEATAEAKAAKPRKADK
jgi:hypothetical protein